MKKMGCLILATAALLMVAVPPADADRGGRHFRSRFNHGRHFHGHSSFGFGVFLGPVWPVYAPYPIYSAPVVIQQSPPVYIQQQDVSGQQYWYYCQAAQAYYPYVQQCPGGWMKVAPSPSGPADN